MKIYEFVISLQSPLGTPMKGDTLFGQFCWEIARDSGLLGMPIEAFLRNYEVSPRIVFSSAVPRYVDSKTSATRYAFKRPDVPLSILFDSEKQEKNGEWAERKKIKKKRWMILGENLKIQSLDKQEFFDDDALFDRLYVERALRKNLPTKAIATAVKHAHNTINRSWGTTGEGAFAPYSVENTYYLPALEFAIFAGVAEDVPVEGVKEGLRRIGAFGFGRDASTGLGKFEAGEVNEIPFPGTAEANGCYTLAPCVPRAGFFSEPFFVPFVRFGRHGDTYAKGGNPFKNPVVMADEGAVFVPETEKRSEIFSKFYIGKALANLSKALPETVGQGYSLYLPVQLEV